MLLSDFFTFQLREVRFTHNFQAKTTKSEVEKSSTKCK